MNSIEKFVSLPQDGTSSIIRVLGIDLGTTNSTVAEVILEPGKAPVCKVLELTPPTEAGEYTSPLIPSVLAQLPDHTVWIGEGAKRLRTFPQKANLFSEKIYFMTQKMILDCGKLIFRLRNNLIIPPK